MINLEGLKKKQTKLVIVHRRKTNKQQRDIILETGCNLFYKAANIA
jgi:hypothetical protein